MGSAMRTWGSALRDLGRFEEAEARLLEAFEMQAAEWGEGHAQTQGTVAALGALYDAWGRPDEAAAWRERIAG